MRNIKIILVIFAFVLSTGGFPLVVGATENNENTATIVATKIVCDSEVDLPNLGNGANITSGTASAFISTHPNCHLASGWDFQWAPEGTPNPGSNITSPAGSPWVTFGQTLLDGTATTLVPSGTLVWVREVLKTGYINFSNDEGANLPVDPKSAEIYCTTDGYNYDNYDWITPVVAGNTYYCVAFNAPIPVDVCPNIEGNQAVVPEGKQLTEGQCVDVVVDLCPNIEGTQATVPSGKQIVEGQCVDIPTPPTDVCPNIEGTQATVPSGKQIVEGQCVDIPVPPTPPTPPGGGGGGNGPIVGSFGGGGGGSVLGASTVGQVLGESCGLYMDKHIRLGSKKNNVDQVKKLQTFLNKWMKSNLPVNGVYDSATVEQVKAFQAKYGDDILKPWGTNTPTGIVYLATLRKINKLECPELPLELPALVPWSQNPNAQ